MNTTTISATEARNRWFEILNRVYFGGESIVIEKNNKRIVRLIPEKKPEAIEPAEVFAKRMYGYLKGKKGSFPYQDNKKIIAKEKAYTKTLRTWK